MNGGYWDLIEEQIINGNNFGSAAWVINVKKIIRQIAADQREADVAHIATTQRQYMEKQGGLSMSNKMFCKDVIAAIRSAGGE